MSRLSALKRPFGFILTAALLLGLCACTAEDQFTSDGEPKPSNPPAAAAGGGGEEEESTYERTPPPVRMPEYVGANQQTRDDGDRVGLIDATNINKGYVAVQATAPVRCRVRIATGDAKDDYELDNDGTMNFYPITRGDGSYTITLYIFLGDTDAGPSYDPFITLSASAALEDEFGPYIVPTRLVRYTPESACVEKSHEITAHAATDLEVIQQIYYWISQNITYDTELATEVSKGPSAYEPDPDETLRTGKGICYDYASLAAAMLRANGIPTKLIKGDVKNPNTGGGVVYHAWNMVWTEDAGWIAVELAANPDDWTRIDTTFAAGGGKDIGGFIGDGENYTPTSQH